MAVFGTTDEFIPNPKQIKFLASRADILLYGGGAGSGKSLCALIWLLGLNNGLNGTPRYQISSYNALIFRKNRKDLADLIKKSKSIYPHIDPGAKYNNSDNYWTFSSGATIYFSYFERYEQCESQIQGQEYQSIVAEEVGQHETSEIFLYCLSRLRGSNGLKPYLRATANPGRYPWLREQFRIDDAGHSTKFETEFELADGTIIKKKVEYIQALLSDNPHIDKNYEASLMMMGVEDRNALLAGRWDAYDVVEGQIFEHELRSFQADHRHTVIKHDKTAKVYTFWDLGINDYCVILFVQFIGKEIRIINMLKGNNKSIRDHWIPAIQHLYNAEGYVYGMHYLPHDAANRNEFTGVSIEDEVKKILIDVTRLVRPSTKLEAIQMARNMFDRVWIDKIHCEELVNDLIRYRRKYDNVNNIWSNLPVHNEASHSADAFMYVGYHKEETKAIDIPQPMLNFYGSVNPFAGRWG